MNNTVNLQLWARTLGAYRAMHGWGEVIIRPGTQPILDLVILEQCSARQEVWFLYPRSDYDTDFWTGILLLPNYENRLNISTAAVLSLHLTGHYQDLMSDSDAWVLSVQPATTISTIQVI